MILFSRNLKEKNLDCQVQVQQAGMTGVITSDCIVPYLDAFVYAIILDWFLSVETTLNHLYPSYYPKSESLP